MFSQALKHQGQQARQTEIRTLLTELKLCSKTKNLRKGKQLHANAIDTGTNDCIYVANSLVNMYTKCGSLIDARYVFDRINHPDVVSWTSLIMGYAENGEGAIALELFARMRSKDCEPNRLTFVAAIKACSSLDKAECLKRGKYIHSEVGCHMDIYVQNSLISMYSKCGSMIDARDVFDMIRNPDVVSWNALISGYTDNGKGRVALDLFARMRAQGCAPSRVTFVAVLKASSSLAVEQDRSARAEFLELGKRIHSEIGIHMDVFVQSALIDMYAKCGSMVEAQRAFDSIRQPDVVSWTALILGYAENGEGVIALDLFSKMKSLGCVPDSITFAAALKACGSLGALVSGTKIHAEIDPRTERKPILVTCLVDFYAKCGNMVEAQKVFDGHQKTRDLNTWTALLSGYSFLGDTKAVFELLEGMQASGLQPDGVTFLCIFTCCSHAGLVENAKSYFVEMTSKFGIIPTAEHYSCMVDIFGRSNKLAEAIALLRTITFRLDSVTWKSVLGACRKWSNLEIGWLAFRSLVSIDEGNSSAYLLMGYIFGSKGMWEEQKMVWALRSKVKVANSIKESLESSYWTNQNGEVHTFLCTQRV